MPKSVSRARSFWFPPAPLDAGRSPFSLGNLDRSAAILQGSFNRLERVEYSQREGTIIEIEPLFANRFEEKPVLRLQRFLGSDSRDRQISLPRYKVKMTKIMIVRWPVDSFIVNAYRSRRCQVVPGKHLSLRNNHDLAQFFGVQPTHLDVCDKIVR